LVFLFFRAEEPDAVLELCYRNLHIFKVLLGLFHSLLYLAKVGHQLRVYIFADVVLPKLTYGDFLVYYPQQILPQIVIDAIILTIKGIKLFLVLVKLGLNLGCDLPLKLLHLQF